MARIETLRAERYLNAPAQDLDPRQKPKSEAGDGNRTHAERASEPLKQAVWGEC